MIESPLVTTDWLESRLGRPRLAILDCSVTMRGAPTGGYRFESGHDAYREAHIPGSVFVDVLGRLAAQDDPRPMMMPAPAELASTLSRHGVGDDSEVVLYDRSNHAWAARVWCLLRTIGFESAAVLDGGWQKWRAEGRPSSSEQTEPEPATLTPRFRPERMATKQQVLESLGEPDVAIVNALTPEQYRGSAPTDFPRAGRIAGSANVYCGSLIDPSTHAYWPAAKLREIFAAAGVLPRERAITYCGAGIAASSDALALTLLGVREVAVYDGSLAEWTADPELPMERG